jgi:hypothetical protein
MSINPRLPTWKAEPLWDELWSWIGSEFPDNNVATPLIEWPPLFCQSILAHDAGAGEASAMACRASVESLGTIFLTHRPDGHNGWTRNFPWKADGRLERWTFSDIQDRLRQSGVLTGDLDQLMNHIKFDGDAAAHISLRMEEEYVAVVQKRPRRPGAPNDLAQLWMTEGDFQRDLEGTLRIIKAVLLAAKAERERVALH